MTTLEMVVRELPPELQAEVFDFAQFLLNTKTKRKLPKRKQKYLRLSLAGALAEYRDRYTSVELQHKISDWRIESEMNTASAEDESV